MVRNIVIVVCLAGCGLLPGAGLDSSATSAVHQGLEILGIEEQELGFFKQWATDSFFRLKAVDRMLDNPLEVAGYVDSSAGLFLENEHNILSLVWLQWLETDVKLNPTDSVRLRKEVLGLTREPVQGTVMLPVNLAKAINTIVAGFEVADRYLEKAVAGLSKKELNVLLGEAPDFWADEDDTLSPTLCGVLHREFGQAYDTAQEVEAETVLVYVRKIERRSLALSGLAVVYAAAEAQRLLTEEPLMFPHEAGTRTVPGIEGGVYFELETEFGLVVVGGDGDNTYNHDCCIIIELGGHDTYRNRAGGAVGVLNKPFSVVIDLKGNDLYSSDRLFSQGAALFGAGVLIDLEGNDVYRSSHYSQGGAIFGTGVLADFDGRDMYDAGFYAQGAGHFGIGLLVDSKENDSYRCLCYGQGFASTWGYGLILDGEGNDQYYAGGG